MRWCRNLSGGELSEQDFELVAGLLLHGGTEGQLHQGAHGAVLHVGDEEVENFLVRSLDRPVQC